MISTLRDAASSMGGVLHGQDQAFLGISTDTRSVTQGELYFALVGPNFDGHDYVADARSRCASAAVVHRMVDDSIAQIAVPDTRLALGDFARHWRASKNVNLVGITGSNGKTTLKEMVASCLQVAGPTLATAGNLNNDIGMPMVLAQIEDQHRFAVIEMGANHVGEIAYLADISAPNVVVITNAGEAHLDGFGSVDGIAKGKGEILQAQSRPDLAVLNADDKYFDYWSLMVADTRMTSFGLSSQADFRADEISTRANGSEFHLHTPAGSTAVALPIPGLHNVRNACAAAAVAQNLGVSLSQIAAALAALTAVDGRLQVLTGVNDCRLFDDSYNANPLSVKAAAEFLAGLPGESWLVLGDMKELGDDAEELHREVGASARTSGIDRLFALGDLSRQTVEAFGAGGKWYGSMEVLINDLTGLTNSTNVLVKGSRSMHMEHVVAALRDDQPVRREA